MLPTNSSLFPTCISLSLPSRRRSEIYNCTLFIVREVHPRYCIFSFKRAHVHVFWYVVRASSKRTGVMNGLVNGPVHWYQLTGGILNILWKYLILFWCSLFDKFRFHHWFHQRLKYVVCVYKVLEIITIVLL